MDVFFLLFIELSFKLFIISNKNDSRFDSMDSSRLSSRLNIALNEASENLKGSGSGEYTASSFTASHL